MRKPLRLRAFAKINLGLQILGKRPDGYHEIRSVYQTIALADRVSIALTRHSHALRVVSNDPRIPGGPSNLVHRACKLWKEKRNFRGGIEILLEKRIPAGSGLGGASSDAAAALLGLERLTGERMDLRSRLKLAESLGSDVPQFFWGGRVLGCGRGEDVYPLWDLPPRDCLVIFPGFAMSTAEAYREASLQLTNSTKPDNISFFGARPHFPLETWGPAENDFEKIVFARWPELAQLKSRLIQAGAELASLTGSGSAVYAVFDSARKFDRALRIIPQSWQVFRSRTLPRNEYNRLMFA